MVRQVTAPILGSVAWSASVAMLPIMVLFILLGVSGWRAERAAAAALLTSVAVAVAGYGTTLLPTLDMVLFGAAFGLVAVVWVILNALWIYNVTVASGHFDALRSAFDRIGGPAPVQVLLIAYCFGGLLEGLIGAGAPVAICAAMLVAIGIPPLKAAVCALIADSVPVAFGTLALPIVSLSSSTGLSVEVLGRMVGRQTPLLAALVPFILLFLVDGWRALKAYGWIASSAGLSFGTMQFLVSNFLSVRLADVLAALVSSAVLALLARYARAEANLTLSTRPVRDVSKVVAGSFSGLVPYLLIVIVFVAAQLPAIDTMLKRGRFRLDWPGLSVALADGTKVPTILTIDVLGTTGTLLLLAGLLTVFVLRIAPQQAWRSYRDTARQIGSATLTVMAIFALAYVSNLSGQTRTMGLLLAGLGPTGFALASPLIGWIGSALTGSDSSSNVLFGNLQVVAAKQVGISPVLAAASNSSGGVVAKAISVQSLAVASATVSLVGQEAAILRRVIGWSLMLLVLMCLLSLAESLPVVAAWLVPPDS